MYWQKNDCIYVLNRRRAQLIDRVYQPRTDLSCSTWPIESSLGRGQGVVQLILVVHVHVHVVVLYDSLVQVIIIDSCYFHPNFYISHE